MKSIQSPVNQAFKAFVAFLFKTANKAEASISKQRFIYNKISKIAMFLLE